MKTLLLVLALVALGNCRIVSKPPISSADLKLLFDDDTAEVAIFDFRTRVERETDGYILSSYPLPEAQRETLEGFKLNDTTLVVSVVNGEEGSAEAEKVLFDLAFTNTRSYIEGMAKWLEVGGPIEFPKEVSFEALNILLDRKSVLLIDVRNRTEYNKVGQIPGSVILPLHEVDKAMALTTDEFHDKYGFLRPEKEDKNVVLTCGSGVRATLADITMKSHGYNHLRIYYGSFDDWRENKGAIIPGQFDIDYTN